MSPRFSGNGGVGQLGKLEDKQFAKGITKKQTFPSWRRLTCVDNELVGWDPSHSHMKTRAYVSTYRWHPTTGFACSHVFAYFCGTALLQCWIIGLHAVVHVSVSYQQRVRCVDW